MFEKSLDKPPLPMALKRMRRNLVACFALAAVGLCLWLVLRLSGPSEPVYQGKRLGDWQKIYESSTNQANRTAAEAAIVQMGSNAVPFLVARMQREAIWISRKSRFNAWAWKWHVPLRFTFFIPTSHWGGQLYLSEETTLGLIGEPATPALLRIFQETSDTNALNVAAQAIYKCQTSSFTRSDSANEFFDWRRFVNDQKKTMLPAAWQRLNNAWFEELML